MKYALTNGILLDGRKNMEPQEELIVTVEDGRFGRIAPANEFDLTDYEVVNLEGGYLMPGLINMHVHLVVDGKAPKSEKSTDYRKLVQSLRDKKLVKKFFLKSEAQHAKTQLLSGVTTLRAVGGIYDWDAITRDRINAGEIVGPRILSSNMAVSVPDGHFAGSLATEARTAEEAAQHVREIAAGKPDLIKLMITGGVMDATEEGEPGALRMPPELVKAACDQAHELGLPVAAHVESAEGVRVALENGVDTIEHGAEPTPEILELFKQRGAALIATLSPALPYSELPLDVAKCGELGRKNGNVVFRGIVDCAKTCLKEGIPVGLGTDTGCPFITHYNMWREVRYFAQYCNVSNAFALHTATLANAQILGMEDKIGSIEAGKCADFIVSAENPLDDLSALRHLRMVARDGKIIRDPAPKPTKGVDAALDPLEQGK